jgi:uncharacterized membrane protein
MVSTKKIENFIVLILIIGTLISVGLVVFGGASYLIQHGFQPLQAHLIKPINKSAASILQDIFTFSSFSMINLGVLVLVLVQILRVGLLVWFYYSIRDKWFTLISAYILIILLYGLFWRR